MYRELLTALALSIAFLSSAVVADENSDFQTQRWVADPDKSRLGFTATQEGAEFSGSFGEFSATLEIVFNKGQYFLQRIDAAVQLDSVDTDYQERDEYLVQKEWFYTKLWPRALFDSNEITDNDGGSFTAAGRLSLRGVEKTVPVALQLSIDENGERGKLLGTASINRLEFGVGAGEWADTAWVGDIVDVEFELYILRAFE